MAEPDEAPRQAMVGSERLRVEPQFTSNRYGNPGYAQLARNCADEIKRGADDESEMGAFHDLFQPQREANLRARLAEYTPAEMDVGIIGRPIRRRGEDIAINVFKDSSQGRQP